MRALVVLTLLVLAGCPGARYGGSFKTTNGAAWAKPGVSGGRTNTVRIADVGGPLARAGLLGLGGLAAAGSVKNVSSTTRTWQAGDYVYRETTTTGQVDEAGMRNAQSIIDEATGNQPVGLTGSLEISTRDLGGDTSGWNYNIGFGTPAFVCGPHLVCFVQGGLGFGKLTFHDRTIRERMDTAVSETIGDSSSYYFGTPLRLTIAPISFVRAYVQADMNWVTFFHRFLGESSSPSPWHFGVELQASLFFVRGEIAASRMTSEATSTMLEVGLGF